MGKRKEAMDLCSWLVEMRFVLRPKRGYEREEPGADVKHAGQYYRTLR